MEPDGTKVEGGVKPETQTTETPKTFTKEEVEQARKDARSAVLAEAGRARKASEDAIKREQATNARIDRILKEQEDAELAAADGNPEQLSAIKERQLRRKSELEKEKLQTELDSHKSRLQELESEKETIKIDQMIREIADKQNVSYDRLSSLAKKFKEVTPEAIEDLAQDLPKKQTTPVIKTDSNVSTGVLGKRTYTADEIGDYEFWKANKTDIEKARGEGRIKT